MADKQVKVRLVADVQSYLAGMKEAQRATLETAQASEGAAQLAQQWGAAASMVGGQLMVVGAAATAGVGLAVNAYAKFDEAMSSVQAATHASAQDMELLTAAARDAGAGTAFSATEAAAGIEELAKAGVSTADILAGGLDGALALAAAGSVDVGFAAETAASAMTQFKLSGGEVTHIADLLAAGAGKAQGGVRELGDALKQSGLVASQMGLSIEETVGGLSAFASAGLMGSDAGTSFKTMLQRLANPSKEAAAQMESLGINAWDAQGNFVGLAEFSGQLQASMKNLSPEARNAAMSVMFGSDAVRAANALYDQGADGINEWIAAVDDSGYAAETAALMQDNLRGDLEKLGGAWDELLISMGQAADGPMRFLVQSLTNLVDLFNGLPDPVKAGVAAIGGVAGGLTLAAGAALVLIPRIAATVDGLKTLGITGDGVKDKLKGAFSLRTAGTVAAITAVSAAISFALQKTEDMKASAEEIQKILNETGDAGEALQQRLGKFQSGGGHEFFESLQGDLDNLEGTLARLNTGNFFEWATTSPRMWGIGDALQDVGKELASIADSDLPKAQSAFRRFAEENELSAQAQYHLLETMDEYKFKLQELAAEQGVNLDGMSEQERQAWLVKAAMGNAADGTSQLTESQQKQADAAAAAAEANEELADSIRLLDDLMGGLVGAENQYYESLDEVIKSVEEHGATLDVTTEAGRANREALRDLAGATTDLAAQMTEAGSSTDEVAAKMREGRAAFIEAAESMGLTKQEAEDLADKYGLIPSKVSTEFSVDTEDATTDILTWHRDHDGMYVQATLGADVEPAEDEVAVWKLQADGTFAVATMDADAAMADETVIAWEQRADGTWAVASMGADAGAAYTSTNQWVQQANGTWAMANVDADTTAANNAINGLNGKTITVDAVINAISTSAASIFAANADGGLYAYANGGFGARNGIYAGGPPIYKFAEPETGWEAFVSGKRGMERQNLLILREAEERLMRQIGQARAFASGGTVVHTTRATGSMGPAVQPVSYSPQIEVNGSPYSPAEIGRFVADELERRGTRIVGAMFGGQS